MFYAYFSAHSEESGNKEITVAWAEHPIGPWQTRDTPMLTLAQVRESIPMGQTIDPEIYTCEETGKSWLLFGNCEAAIVELTPCMTDWVRGTLYRYEGAVNFREAIKVNFMDGWYHFTWSCDDTGSANYHVRYGIADNLFGPILHKGVLLARDDTAGILGTGHHNIFQHPQTGEWYILYHRLWTPPGQFRDGGPGNHREICMERLVYRDGSWLPVRPGHAGVG